MPEISLLQKQVLDLFVKSDLKNKFYWTGGTALSHLYLHHRRSNDLDFFSDESFTYERIIGFIRKLKKELKLPRIEEEKIYDRREFFLYNKQKLRLEFVYYPHPKIKNRKLWKGLRVDSLDDLAANKLMSHFDRNDPKDLFDLYFLLIKKRYTLKKLIKLVEKKFGVRFSEGVVFSEAYKTIKELNELKPLILTKNSSQKDKLIREIQEYFTSRSDQYLRRFLK